MPVKDSFETQNRPELTASVRIRTTVVMAGTRAGITIGSGCGNPGHYHLHSQARIGYHLLTTRQACDESALRRCDDEVLRRAELRLLRQIDLPERTPMPFVGNPETSLQLVIDRHYTSNNETEPAAHAAMVLGFSTDNKGANSLSPRAET